MELGLIREVGVKSLLAGGGALFLYWTYTCLLYTSDAADE